MSLIINSKLFEDLFTDDLSQPENVCKQARTAGHVVRHAPPLGISDSELTGVFDALFAFLSDTKHQTNNPKTIPGLQMLKKLKSCPYLTSIDDEIVIEPLTSSSSDESSLKEDISGDSSEGSSDVDDGWETDRDSLSHDSVSLTSDGSFEDSHGIYITANQSVINRVDERALQTSEAEIQLLRNTFKDNMTKRTKVVRLNLRWIVGLAVHIGHEMILEIVCLVFSMMLHLINIKILIQLYPPHVIISATGEYFIEENALWKLFFVPLTTGLHLITLLIFIYGKQYGHVKRKLRKVVFEYYLKSCIANKTILLMNIN